MFKKFKKKREIEKSKQLISLLEQKRSRSQAALVEAILQHTSPRDEDVDYFNRFTAQIDAERERMHKLMQELEELSK